MDTLPLLQALVQAWNQCWPELEDDLSRDLTPASSGRVLEQLLATLHQVARAGFEAWLLRNDHPGDTLVRDSRTLRFKCVQEKEFLTPLGPVKVARRLFQADRGGPCFAPIDAAWGMVGQSATPEIREAAAYLLGLMPAEEAERTLTKISRFRLGETSLKKLAGEFGEWIETHPEAVAEVRAAETIPEGTRVVCVSLDGTNVRLNEPGPKPGRPPSGDLRDLEPTCFKNAMVGTVSCYGETDAAMPERLQTKSVARMPEDSSPTFRKDLEAEVASTLARCEPGVTRVLVIDAAHFLWKYVESQPLFAGFEKIVDYYHAAEHLGTAAEALFGKGTPEAKVWAAKHRRTLLESDDGAARVVRAINAATRVRRLPAWARKVVATQRKFFTNHGRRMTYASFRARGLPIGSGPVEAAGKVLVKQRMVRSGMRWSRRGGQHILNIRTLIKSKRWDAVWVRYCETALAA
jgi:hypothetical protein